MEIKNLNDYQTFALRTRPAIILLNEKLIMGALGISGEAGEVTDYIKKIIFHGHALDRDELIKELGDVMWYVAYLGNTIGVDLQTIAEKI